MKSPIWRYSFMTLREWRKTNGLTLAQAAARLGFNVQTLSRYERGERWPTRSAMYEIIAGTGGAVTADEMLNPGTPEAAA